MRAGVVRVIETDITTAMRDSLRVVICKITSSGPRVLVAKLGVYRHHDCGPFY